MRDNSFVEELNERRRDLEESREVGRRYKRRLREYEEEHGEKMSFLESLSMREDIKREVNAEFDADAREDEIERFGSEALYERVDDRRREGWSVSEVEVHRGRVVMEKAGTQSLVGHVIVALLTLWWTFGLGNYLYYQFRKRQGESLVVRADR